MIDKYQNQKYGTLSGQNVPLVTGDRRWAQDRVRDFWYHVERAGLSAYDLYGMLPFFISGGVVTQGAGASLDITAGFGYAKYEVEIPDTFASLPPSSTNEDVEAHRIEWPLKNDMNAGDANCSTYSITDDGVTVHYVKVQFLEEDGNTRDRAKFSGNYAYEKVPSYNFVIDTVAPTDYDIVLDTFTSSGGTYTFAGDPAQKLDLPTMSDISPRVYRDENEILLTHTGSPHTINNTDNYGKIYINASGGNVVLNLPDRASNNGRTYEIISVDDPGSNTITINRAGSDTISDSGLTSVQLAGANDYIKIIASSVLSRWEILDRKLTCQLRLTTFAAYGSTDTAIPTFSTLVESIGNAFSHNHGAYGTSGLEITLNLPGTLHCNLRFSSGGTGTNIGHSINSTQRTTSIAGISSANLITETRINTSATTFSISCSIKGKAFDVIRPHCDPANTPSVAANCSCLYTFE